MSVADPSQGGERASVGSSNASKRTPAVVPMFEGADMSLTWRPVAGSVALDSARIKDSGYLLADRSQAVMNAQFRNVRQRLLESVQQRRQSPASLIAITSSVPGEGKSFVSLNLALNLASDRKTLVTLVDFDLTRPRMTQLLDCDGRRGLVNTLSENGDLADAAYSTPIPNLSFIPIGVDPQNDIDLLSGRSVDDLVSRLRTLTEPHVFVFDCPPMLANEDARHLSQRSDLAVIVVRADSTPQHWVTDAIEKMGPRANVALLLNGRTGSMAEDHYGYGATLKDYLGT